MKNPFTALKEKGIGLGIKSLVNREIEGFGEVQDLSIDTEEKTMHVELDLKGEPSRVEISVGSYQVSEKDGKVFIKVKKLKASREWITAVLNKYIADKPFEAPSAAKILM